MASSNNSRDISAPGTLYSTAQAYGFVREYTAPSPAWCQPLHLGAAIEMISWKCASAAPCVSSPCRMHDNAQLITNAALAYRRAEIALAKAFIVNGWRFRNQNIKHYAIINENACTRAPGRNAICASLSRATGNLKRRHRLYEPPGHAWGDYWARSISMRGCKAHKEIPNRPAYMAHNAIYRPWNEPSNGANWRAKVSSAQLRCVKHLSVTTMICRLRNSQWRDYENALEYYYVNGRRLRNDEKRRREYHWCIAWAQQISKANIRQRNVS